MAYHYISGIFSALRGEFVTSGHHRYPSYRNVTCRCDALAAETHNDMLQLLMVG